VATDLKLSSKLALKDEGTNPLAKERVGRRSNVRMNFMGSPEGKKRGKLPLTEVTFPLSTNH
jgi:hypothetical protein